MNGIGPRPSIVSSILAEHRQLHETVNGIKALLAQHNRDEPMTTSWQMLNSRLLELQRHLAEHFAREEKGGFLEEAAVKLPRLTKRVIALEKEHPELLHQIDALLELVPSVQATPSDWTRLAGEFDRFARRLAAHEATESHLVEEGFNRDIRLTD